MFCQKCGAQCAEGIAFCDKCGAPIENTQAAEYQYVPELQPKKENKKLITIIVAALAVVVVFVGALLIFGGNSPEDVAEEYFMAMVEGDLETEFECELRSNGLSYEDYIEKYCDVNDMKLEEYFELREDRYETEIEDYDDLIDAAKQSQEESLIEEFGKYDISFEIISTKELTEKKLKELCEEIEEYYEDSEIYSIDVDEIEEACSVKYKASIEGEDDSDTDKGTITVVKYDGEWKVFD